MQVIDAKFYDSHPGQFSISVLGREVYLAWAEKFYSFKLENGQVYFLMGGQEKDKKLAGEAKSQEQAIEKATEYLEWWLKECRAIGDLEASYHLKVNREDSRGSGFFTLQVWVRDKDEKEKDRRDTLFTFALENGQVYYLGDDKEERRDLVKFVYRAWQSSNLKPATKRELNVFPKDKEEAIRDAIDYLEWWLSEQGRL